MAIYHKLHFFKNDELRINFLNNIFKLTYIKDIIERYDIRNDESLLFSVVKLLSSDVSCLINPLNISNTFKSKLKIDISSNTIKQYLNHIIDSYIVNECIRYDIKGNKYLHTPTKYYFSDLGIRNSLINFNNINRPRIIENIVYNHLISLGFDVFIGNVNNCTKENNKTVRNTYEVDFIVRRAGNTIYIQVADSIENEEKVAQEIKSLKSIKTNLKK